MYRRNGGETERGGRLSTDDIAGYALGGEFNVIKFLQLFTHKKRIVKVKYTGSRKALRRLLKARKEKEQTK